MSDERKVDEQLGRVPKIRLHDVPHHTNHGFPVLRTQLLYPPADRILARPQQIGCRFAHDHVAQGGNMVRPRERSAAQDIDPHGSEVVAGGIREPQEGPRVFVAPGVLGTETPPRNTFV